MRRIQTGIDQHGRRADGIGGDRGLDYCAIEDASTWSLDIVWRAMMKVSLVQRIGRILENV